MTDFFFTCPYVHSTKDYFITSCLKTVVIIFYYIVPSCIFYTRIFTVNWEDRIVCNVATKLWKKLLLCEHVHEHFFVTLCPLRVPFQVWKVGWRPPWTVPRLPCCRSSCRQCRRSVRACDVTRHSTIWRRPPEPSCTIRHRSPRCWTTWTVSTSTASGNRLPGSVSVITKSLRGMYLVLHVCNKVKIFRCATLFWEHYFVQNWISLKSFFSAYKPKIHIWSRRFAQTLFIKKPLI